MESSSRAWIFVALALAIAIAAPAMALDLASTSDRAEPAAFFFTDFEDNLQDLSLLGDAKFVRIEGQVDGMAVQLSGTRKNTVGRLLYSIPINMLHPASGEPVSFSTFFEFSMSAFAGDGLAFVLVPDKTSIGASGPWLGLVKEDEIANRTATAPHTFAVEFDSVMNMELRDPNSNHVGLDVETIVSAVTANASDIGLTLNDGSRTFAWIEFDGVRSELDVRISKDGGERPATPLLLHRVEIARVLKPWMFVGFSSSTGEAWQKHKIFSWKFSSSGGGSGGSGGGSDGGVTISRRWWWRSGDLNAIHSLPANPLAPSEQQGKEKSSATRFFDNYSESVVMIVVGVLCAVSAILFLVVGWALIARTSRFNADDYQEIS